MRTSLVLTLGLVLGACRSGGPGDENRPPYLHVRMVVPESFETALVAAAEIELRPVDAPLPLHEGTGFFDVGGIPVTVRSQDRDGDGRLEILVSFGQNPFRGLRADLYLYPFAVGAATTPATAESPPVQVVARLFASDGRAIAEGQATRDLNGTPVRFGGQDRSVEVFVTCLPGAICDRGTVVTGTQVVVTRARDCPLTDYVGNLYVFLFPAFAGPVTPLSAHRNGVDFAAPDATVTLELPGTRPGPYYVVAVHDVHGDLPPGSTLAGPGDLVSALRPVEIVSGRLTVVRVALESVQGVGPCTGGRPEAPPAPAMLRTEPPSPANENNPIVAGEALPGTSVRVYANDSTCQSSAPVGTGIADASGLFAIPVQVGDDTITTFYASARNAAQFVSVCSPVGVTYVEDSTAPAAPTGITTTPRSPSNLDTVTVRGIAEAGSSVPGW